jgi:hypothetical protein
VTRRLLAALGGLVLAGGIAVEACGLHTGGYGFICNAAAVTALALWAAAGFANGRRNDRRETGGKACSSQRE